MILLSFIASLHSAWACEATFLNGVLTTSEPLEMLTQDSKTLSQKTTSCLQNIGSTVSTIPGFRQLTIAFAVDSGNRKQALQSAQKFVDVLTNSGVSAPRISYSFPRATDGNSKISMAYSARVSNIQVAALAGMSGIVRMGTTQESLIATSVGQKIAIGTYIETGPGSYAYIVLVDGSKIRIEENSLIRINKIQKDENGQRDVTLQLEKGSFETEVSKTGGKYEVRTDGGVAGVRGTRFRVVAKEQENTNPTETESSGTIDKLKAIKNKLQKGSKDLQSKAKKKLETIETGRSNNQTLQVTTYEGSVALSNTDKTKQTAPSETGEEVLVKAGFFSETNIDGQSTPNMPKAIPQTPIVYGPRIGKIRKNPVFSWSESQKEDETRYVIEIARDAGFSVDVQQYYSTLPNIVLRSNVAPGDWYWHVAAINKEEVRSDWSTTFGFSVPYDVR